MARDVRVKIIGDSSSFERSLKSATGATTKFTASVKDMAKVGAASLGLVGVAEGFKDIIDKAEESQVSMAKLNAAFKSSGVSMAQYAAQVEKAQEAGRRLGFSNIDTQAGLAKLVVATQNGATAIKDLATAQDLARFKHISLASASQMLAQAMTGSARAVKQLGIYVPPVTTHLDQLRAAHKAAGDAATQQEIAAAKLADKQATGARIIEIVTQRLHGQADAYSKTASGAIARFRAALEDVEERIGQRLLPTMTKWINYLADHLPQIEQFFQGIADKVSAVADAVNKVVTATAGWKRVIEALLALALAKWLNTFLGGLFGTKGIISGLGAASAAAGPGKGLLGRLTLLTMNPWVITLTVIGLDTLQEKLDSLDKNLKARTTRVQIPGKAGITYDPTSGQFYGGDKGAQIPISIETAAKALGISVDKLRALVDKQVAAARATTQPLRPPGAEVKRGGAQSLPGGGKLPTKTAPGATSQEQQLLNFAKMLLGTPYVYGAMSKAGIDCSGLVAWAYGKLGINLPHSTYAQVGMGQFVTGGQGGMTPQQMARLRPGDIIFSQYGEGGRSGPGHEALYAGGGQVIVARHRGTRVQYQPVSDMIGGGAYSVRRILGDVGPGEGFDPSILDDGSGAPGAGRSRTRHRKTIPASHLFERSGSAVLGTVKLADGDITKLGKAVQQAEARREARITAQQMATLRPFAPGMGAGPTSKQALNQEFGQIQGQISTGMTGITGRTRAELAAIRRVLDQPWISPAVRERVRAMLDGIRQTFTDRIAAIKTAAANVGSAFQSFGQNVLSAFDAISANWKSPAGEKLQQMQAEDALKSAQDAYAQAVEQYGADSPEAKAAARAFEEAQLAAQQAEQEKAHADKVKADKDALEKRLAELEKQASGAKTRAQAARIQKEINKVLAEFGITPETVQGAMDWNAQQTLFVSSLGTLNQSIHDLIAAINGNTDEVKKHPTSPTYPVGGGPPPGGTGGHPPPEGQALGGHITGTGTGIDTVPAWLTPGEYVIRKAMVRKYGRRFMDMVNAGRYQGGGPIPPPPIIKPGSREDTPKNRAAQAASHDWGIDNVEGSEVHAALLGDYGRRAQVQAMERAKTIVDGYYLPRVPVLSMSSKAFSEMAKWRPIWESKYPGIVFEEGSDTQVGWQREMLRARDIALPDPTNNPTLLMHMTDGAVHMGGDVTVAQRGGGEYPLALFPPKGRPPVQFGDGGYTLSDGYAFLHKNEAIIPLDRGTGPIEIVVQLDREVLVRAVTKGQQRNGRSGRPGISPANEF